MPRANLLAFCISIIFFCVPGEATEGGDGGGSEEHSNSVRRFLSFGCLTVFRGGFIFSGMPPDCYIGLIFLLTHQ